MPTIAIVDGVRILIYPKDHMPAYIHAMLGGAEVQISIATGRVLNGKLPKAKLKLVQAWLDANRPYAAYMWREMVTRQRDGGQGR